MRRAVLNIIYRLRKCKQIVTATNVILTFYYKHFNCKVSGVSSEIRNNEEIIVSLTSIPSRINKLWICIESLLGQSYKPNRIILWLSKEKFNDEVLPEALIRQRERGLEIRYCTDLGPHSKYFYTLKENPKAILVTVDDDIIYKSNMLRELVREHNKYPKEIICHRAHKILFNSDGKVKKYSDWLRESHFIKVKGATHLLLQTGVSGVLYPPGSLNSEVLSKEKFMKMCPKADDIWLKVMAIMNDTMVRKVRPLSRHYIEIPGTQTENLTSVNVYNGGNDQQFRNLMEDMRVTVTWNNLE